MSKRLGGIKGCKYKISSWQLAGSPMIVTLGQQHNVGEKPTVKLYTYINRHAGTPKKNRLNSTSSNSNTDKYSTQFSNKDEYST